MKQKLYTVIGALIIISGLVWYMQLHISEYHVQQQLEAKANVPSPENSKGTEVNGLLKKGKEEDAIDKLIKMVKDAPDDLGVKLKLTQVYCNQCILDTLNCENALWQLNYILKTNPDQQDALDMKKRIDVFLSDSLINMKQ